MVVACAATAGRGPTLRQSLERIAGDAVTPVIALIKAAVKDGDAATLPPLVQVDFPGTIIISRPCKGSAIIEI